MYELQKTTHTVDNNNIHTRNHNYYSWPSPPLSSPTRERKFIWEKKIKIIIFRHEIENLYIIIFWLNHLFPLEQCRVRLLFLLASLILIKFSPMRNCGRIVFNKNPTPKCCVVAPLEYLRQTLNEKISRVNWWAIFADLVKLYSQTWTS